MPSMWQKRQDSNPSHSVLETEILVINIDVPAPKWFMVNHQSTPLFAQVAVSVAVKISDRGVSHPGGAGEPWTGVRCYIG